MFHNRSAVSSSGVIGASIGLLVAVVVATGLNVWLVAENRKQQHAIGEIMAGGSQEDIRRLGSLPADLGWQLAFTIVVLVVLIVAAVTLLFVVRAYLASQATLLDTVTLSRDVLESIDYGVITTDTEGHITSINPQACELLTLTSEPMGLALASIIPYSTPLADMSRDVLASGTAIHDRAFALDVDDRRRELRVDCHTLRGVSRQLRGTVLHVRDITQQTLLEQRMRRMERFMSLGTLAAGLHHEIKNPLSALSLHVQLLEEGLADSIDEPLLENLNVLKTEVTRIAGVLESFRDYASMDQLDTMPLDVVQVVQQAVDLLGPQAQQQAVAIIWRGEPATLPPVMADAVRLEQVLLNLALNALEAMRQGGELSLSTRCEDGQVVVSIADTGGGIPDNVRSFVLDPYFTTKSGGSGMGLALCDKIIRQHGGQLSFATSPSGTVFQVALPMVNEI